MKERENVRPESSLQLFCGDLLKRILRVLFRGIVHQDIKPAEFLHHSRDRSLAKLLVANVASNRQSTPPHVLHLFDRISGVLVLIQVKNRNVSALVREGNSHCLANAAITSRDERNAPGKFWLRRRYFR